VTAVKGEKIMW